MDLLEKELRRVEAFGLNNDEEKGLGPHKMLNIPRETGEFLYQWVLKKRPLNILELGTSNGYSTLWLARAAMQYSGKITTIESKQYKIDLATENFKRSDVLDCISLIRHSAEKYLTKCDSHFYQFVFLDADRSQYVRWWPEISRVLEKRGTLFIDNAISHAQDLIPLIKLIDRDPRYNHKLHPIGKGVIEVSFSH